MERGKARACALSNWLPNRYQFVTKSRPDLLTSHGRSITFKPVASDRASHLEKGFTVLLTKNGVTVREEKGVFYAQIVPNSRFIFWGNYRGELVTAEKIESMAHSILENIASQPEEFANVFGLSSKAVA